MWRALRVDEQILTGGVNDEEMAFGSRRALREGICFTTCVLGFPYDVGWMLRVSGSLTDERVRSLESDLAGPNPINPCVFEFDVSATHKFLEGKTFVTDDAEHSLPSLSFDVPDAAVNTILGTYSGWIDRIWASVDGYDIEGGQKLALWVMRNYNFTKAGSPTIAMACAALIYGDRTLSAWLLRGYEETRVLYVPHGVDSYARSPSGEMRPDIAKLSAMLEQDGS